MTGRAAQGQPCADDLAQALARLPDCTLVLSDQALALANTATFETHQVCGMIVRPRTAQAVAEVVALAHRAKATLHPVGRGQNLGFGSRVPASTADLLLDLSDMTGISDYDPEAGTVRVEPGVSFQALSDFLDSQGNRHFVSCIGGPPQASVLGNILTKGDGTGPLWNRAAQFSAPDLVLANGDKHRSTRHPMAAASRAGIGPDLTGLWLQSSLAVVTSASVWLSPVPEQFHSYLFRLAAATDLVGALGAVRDLHARGLLTAPVTFWNDYKQAATTGLRGSAFAERPLRRARLQAHSNRYAAWTCFGGLYQDDARVARAVYKAVCHALGPHALRVGPFDHLYPAKLRALSLLGRILPKALFQPADLLGEARNSALLGRPGPGGQRSLYWRKPDSMAPDDPHWDGCGVLWNAVELPLAPGAVHRLMQDLETVIFDHGFEPFVTLLVPDHRCLRLHQQILYDRFEEDADPTAWACHRAVAGLLAQHGARPLRLTCRDPAPPADPVAAMIKGALDPGGTFSPKQRKGF